jgi:hypothetical protein
LAVRCALSSEGAASRLFSYPRMKIDLTGDLAKRLVVANERAAAARERQAAAAESNAAWQLRQALAFEKLADELAAFQLAYSKVNGLVRPPDPVQSPTVTIGKEIDMAIEVKFTPVDIESEGFDQLKKDEISQWQLTPVFNGVDQEPIVGDKGDLAVRTVKAPDATTVFVKHKWIDNAGNPSNGFTQSESVLAADKTPPADPVNAPGIEVGEEVPD